MTVSTGMETDREPLCHRIEMPACFGRRVAVRVASAHIEYSPYTVSVCHGLPCWHCCWCARRVHSASSAVGVMVITGAMPRGSQSGPGTTGHQRRFRPPLAGGSSWRLMTCLVFRHAGQSYASWRCCHVHPSPGRTMRRDELRGMRGGPPKRWFNGRRRRRREMPEPCWRSVGPT